MKYSLKWVPPYYLIDIVLFYILGDVIYRNYEKGYYGLFWMVAWLAIAIGIHFASTLGLNIWIESIIKGKDIDLNIDSSAYVRAIWRGIYILILATSYWLAFRGIRSERYARKLEVQKAKDDLEKLALERDNLALQNEKLILEQEKLKLENTSLRLQINPHMILNALDTLHDKYVGVSPEADEIVLLLVDQLQDMLNGIDADGLIPLTQEIDNIRRCIRLNALTSDTPLCLDLEIDDTMANDDLRIPPVLLISPVENMFKHGVIFNKQSPAKLSIHIKGNELSFYAWNDKKPPRSHFSNGIGLQNAISRLKNYYPERHHLDIKNLETEYITTLKITL